MTFWKDIYFMDSNSPTMEMLLFFHDHNMMIMMIIMTFLSMSFIMLFMEKKKMINMIDNQLIELIWTLSPFILLILIGFPSINILYIMEESFKYFFSLKITGYQWYWSYSYIDMNHKIDCFMKNKKNINHFRLIETSNTMSIPMKNNIRMLITSNDVIHSWTIQNLGMKMDAIPGRINQTMIKSLRPGIYFGQCSEICGINHSFMPIMLKIMNMKNFLVWYKTIMM